MKVTRTTINLSNYCLHNEFSRQHIREVNLPLNKRPDLTGRTSESSVEVFACNRRLLLFVIGTQKKMQMKVMSLN